MKPQTPIILAGLLGAFMLTGCATGYQDSNSFASAIGLSTGGYWEQKGPGKLIKIGFSGNGFIAKEKVSTYLMYRCATVVKREGGTYFAMYKSLPNAISDRRTLSRQVDTIAGKPDTYAYVLLIDKPEPDALSADEVIAKLKPEVEPGK